MTPHLSLLNIAGEQMRDGLNRRCFTSKDLVRAYIARIHDVNHEVHAVVEINPDALAIAEALDNERSRGHIRGPLHGVPILIKDNMATADSMQTTAGSFCLEGAKPPRDASVVALLRKAALVVLGKTNMSEWANFRSRNSSDGWSARGNQTFGSYRPMQYTCGSSSGSAVAASIGLSFASVGTETDSSITCLSAYNSIAGIKPTVGLVSRDLIISGSFRQDSVGPMARSIKDAALLLSAMAGHSGFDNATDSIPFNVIPDFTKNCHPDALQRSRIGVLQNLKSEVEANRQVLDAFHVALGYLRDAGATVMDVDYPHLHEFRQLPIFKALERELNDGIVDYLRTLDSNPRRVSSVQDIVTCLEQDPREKADFYDVEVFKNSLKSPTRDSAEYQSIVQTARRLTVEEGLLSVMHQHNLTAIVPPESVKLATSIAAAGGFPVVTVPLGYYAGHTRVTMHKGGTVETGPGVPFGLQLIGRHFDEARLVGYAHAFEHISCARNQAEPIIVPKTDLGDVLPEYSRNGLCPTPSAHMMLSWSTTVFVIVLGFYLVYTIFLQKPRLREKPKRL